MYVSVAVLEEMKWLANGIIDISKKINEYQPYSKICICVITSF